MYATVNDIEVLWRTLTTAEKERAEALIPVVEDLLRQAVLNEGYRDDDGDAVGLEDLIFQQKINLGAVKAVVVDIVARVLRQSTTGDAMSQESQSALGYTWQGTYAIPGGGIANAIMRSDLKRLGLHKQQIKAVEMYDSRRYDPAHDPHADGR